MAFDLNQICVTGRLGADPELKHLNGGDAVLNIRLAVSGSEKRGGQYVDTTTWFRVAMFGKRAEGLAKFLAKGHRVAVSGRLTVREFDKKDGTKGTSVEISASDVVSLDSKKADGQATRSSGQRAATPEPTSELGDDTFGEDDIPF